MLPYVFVAAKFKGWDSNPHMMRATRGMLSVCYVPCFSMLISTLVEGTTKLTWLLKRACYLYGGFGIG